MSFTCAICSLEIQTGEPMLSNDKMELAHKSCVDRRVDMDPPSAVQVQAPATPKPALAAVVLAVRAVARCPRCGSPLGPVLRGSYANYPDSRFCESCVRFIEEPRQPSSPPCDTSTSLPVMKPASVPTFDTIEIVPVRKNGRHVKKKHKKRNRC